MYVRAIFSSSNLHRKHRFFIAGRNFLRSLTPRICFLIQMLLFIPVKLRREGGYRYFSKDTLIAIFRFTWPSVVLLLSGFIITSVLTDLPKAVIGRLRPHFFDVCQPVYSGNCTPTRGYITDYKCRGKGFPENTIYDMR